VPKYLTFTALKTMSVALFATYAQNNIRAIRNVASITKVFGNEMLELTIGIRQ
jgi:hypothetical protein